jgi:uncharacterized damage-inducible protein DinB
MEQVMNKSFCTALCLLLVSVLSTTPNFLEAQSSPTAASSAANSVPRSSVPTSGVRAEFLNELKIQEDKFIQLAQAMPAEKYTWRPAEGVRSVSEVYLHVATANYNLPHVFGAAAPAGFKADGFDKSTTDNAKIIETLKDSFDHMRQAVLNMPDSDVERLDWFGAKSTYRGVMLFVIRHGAEHLGQSIAYARMNGVIPPWTEEQQQQQQKKQTGKP